MRIASWSHVMYRRRGKWALSFDFDFGFVLCVFERRDSKSRTCQWSPLTTSKCSIGWSKGYTGSGRYRKPRPTFPNNRSFGKLVQKLDQRLPGIAVSPGRTSDSRARPWLRTSCTQDSKNQVWPVWVRTRCLRAGREQLGNLTSPVMRTSRYGSVIW